MLILGRKRDEKVIIQVPPSTEPTLIEVTLVEADQGRGRLGFNCPGKVQIDREEVYQENHDGGQAEPNRPQSSRRNPRR